MNDIINIPTRKQIEELEKYVLKLPQVDMPVTHDFCSGLYIRTLFIPAGTLLTGAVHKEENYLFVRAGDIVVWTEQGMQRLFAGSMIKSSVGCKRVGFAIKDTVLSNVHANPTNEQNEKKLWDLYTVPASLPLIED